MTTCTEVSAHWCPVHGDCTCPRHTTEDWDDADAHPELADSDGQDPDCPLHSVGSDHGERRTVVTLWGPVDLPYYAE